MGRRLKPALLPAALAVVFWGAWSLMSDSFVRGVLVGLAAGVGTLFAAILVFSRIMRRRMATRCAPCIAEMPG